MPAYGTIRKQLSKKFGEEAQLLKDLDACIHALKCQPMKLPESVTKVLLQPNPNLEAELVRLRERICQVEDARDSDRHDFKQRLAVSKLNNLNTLKSMICNLLHANRFYPDIVEDLLAYPPIAKDVQQPGSRLVIWRPAHWTPSDHQNGATFSGGPGSVDICNNAQELSLMLATYESWMFLFGCGSGYVTDECLFVGGCTAHAWLPVTAAIVNLLIGFIEDMARKGMVRKIEDGIRVWRTPD